MAMSNSSIPEEASKASRMVSSVLKFQTRHQIILLKDNHVIEP